MKVAAIPLFLMGRLYAKQTGKPFWKLQEQLDAIKQLLAESKNHLS